MQKLSDVRFPAENDIPALKELWHIAFGDDFDYINKFFSTAFQKENALVIYDGDTVVSALYLIEGHIFRASKRYKAYYVYAVATLPLYRGKGLMTALLSKADEIAKERGISYLFLVPANSRLYDMYEKLGYKRGFFCQESVAERKSVTCKEIATHMDYESYLACRNRFPLDESVVFGENGFNLFISPDGGEINNLYIENIGCCVYERLDDEVVVWELFGDESILLDKVFELCDVHKLRYRTDVSEGGSPCGMYKSFGDVPKLKTAFIGAHGG